MIYFEDENLGQLEHDNWRQISSVTWKWNV